MQLENFLEISKNITVNKDWIDFKNKHSYALQLSYKIFLNSLYGATGNIHDPICFCLPVAGGATTLGKQNILEVNSFLTDNNCEIYYNDTDSSYFSAPRDYFKDLDKKYYSGQMDKHKYSHMLVEMTQKYASDINPELNKHIQKKSKSSYLKLNYEAVLYPAIWAGKKKYCGISHEELINFIINIENFYVKGLGTVRRESSGFLKRICEEIIYKLLDIYNKDDIIHVCEKTILEVYKRTFDKKDFVKTAVYRPGKNNVAKSFYDRMCERFKLTGKDTKPIPNERFKYIIVERYPWKFDHRGRKSNLQIGDKMEYLSYVEENNLKIDMDYYITEIIGVIARLAAYHPMFHVNPVSDSAEDHKKSEEKIYANAKKYLETLMKPTKVQYTSKSSSIKTTFRCIDNKLTNNIIQYTGISSSGAKFLTNDNKHTMILKNNKFSNEDNKRKYLITIISETIIIDILKQAVKQATKFAQYFIENEKRKQLKCITNKRSNKYKNALLHCLHEIIKQYKYQKKERMIYWRVKEDYINNQIYTLTSDTITFHNHRDTWTINTVNKINNSIKLNSIIEDTDDDTDWNQLLDKYSAKDIIDTNNLVSDNITIINNAVRIKYELISFFEKLIRPNIIVNRAILQDNIACNIIDKPAPNTILTVNDYKKLYFG